MRVIDFHTYVCPQKITEKAMMITGEFCGLKTEFVGTSNVLLECGK